MKLSFLAVLLFFIPSEATIEYRQLNYNDFAGTPQGEWAALSTTGIQTEPYQWMGVTDDRKGTKSRIWFRAKAYFVPEKSFMRVKTEAILRHEQVHFAITYFFAAKINSLLRAHGPYLYNESGAAYKLHDSVFAEMDKIQKRYDKETDYSRNDSAQASWERKIVDNLIQYPATHN